ncbi:D-allulose 6-phosphate 3-epimerase [Pseudoleptotrichia goodfellowii]|uniref:Putative D-allulose-6-phosphate 3-epimerase n=1 Tax=Pseudoleptotrichia goodfellowii TaxID=157692 RepID=A0A510J7T5_9FUSO|nr:D-allulose 6-phosphate 3-epimerase [Pseudoleptotrichia goodfellowii]BBM35352.1 ribulose-phosphate 3-epimerase [Pseudoleptotrichia goodfellowii]
MEKMKFSPSLMCMDLTKFKEQVDILNERADFYHVDIMDGHFVKNITLSPFFVEQLNKITKLPIDVHLMVEFPGDYIDELAKSGATYICPHAETINKDAFRVINKIKSLGCKAGVVLNPSTPVEWIKYYIHLVDKITIMTVDPGFAGQPFIPEMLEKIKELKKIKEENNYSYLIEIDGSCNERTFKRLTSAGAEVLIVGSSGLFNLEEDLVVAWNKMIEIFNREIAE